MPLTRLSGGSGSASGGTASGSSGGTATGSTSGTSSGSSSGAVACPVISIESSDAGSCAPQVMFENCNGGEVLFPCGLPDNPDQDCVPYCGSNAFQCFVDTNNGVIDQDYPVPWDDTDAGANPVGVQCFPRGP